MTTDRKMPQWVENLLGLVTNPRVLALIAAGFGLGGGAGTILADAGGATPAEVRKIADSTAEAKVDSLRDEFSEARAETRAAFGALMKAIPAFKQAVQDLGQANAEARREKAETDQMLENLTGGLE